MTERIDRTSDPTSDDDRGMVTVTYVVDLAADRVEEVLSQVRAMLPLARSQPGNLRLDVHQSASDPARIMMFERWTSEADLARWLNDDRLKSYFARLTPLFAREPAITHWRLLGSDQSAPNGTGAR